MTEDDVTRLVLKVYREMVAGRVAVGAVHTDGIEITLRLDAAPPFLGAAMVRPVS